MDLPLGGSPEGRLLRARAAVILEAHLEFDRRTRSELAEVRAEILHRDGLLDPGAGVMSDPHVDHWCLRVVGVHEEKLRKLFTAQSGEVVSQRVTSAWCVLLWIESDEGRRLVHHVQDLERTLVGRFKNKRACQLLGLVGFLTNREMRRDGSDRPGVFCVESQHQGL